MSGILVLSSFPRVYMLGFPLSSVKLSGRHFQCLTGETSKTFPKTQSSSLEGLVNEIPGIFNLSNLSGVAAAKITQSMAILILSLSYSLLEV